MKCCLWLEKIWHLNREWRHYLHHDVIIGCHAKRNYLQPWQHEMTWHHHGIIGYHGDETKMAALVDPTFPLPPRGGAALSCYCNASSLVFGMSNISAKSGGSVSLSQRSRNHCSWSMYLVPSILSSGSFIKMLAKRAGSVEWFRETCSFNASISLSCILSTPAGSFRAWRSRYNEAELELFCDVK